MLQHLRIFVAGVIIFVCQLTFAQSTSFTYQGRLADNGNAAQGVYDFTFWLYDSSTNGNLINGPLVVPSVPVANGLFNVSLDFGSSAFSGGARWLEIGVRTNGSLVPATILQPRQNIASTPYAITAANVTGPINGAAILNGTIPGTKLADNSITAAILGTNSVGTAQLGSGAAIVSTNATDATLIAAGFINVGRIAEKGWERLASGNEALPVVSGRSAHSAIWDGTDLLIWGGFNGDYLNDGATYNVASNKWSALPLNGAPSARIYHTALWTGAEMLIWGGADETQFYNDGGRFNPATKTWNPLPTNGAPSARMYHTAVWTGSEMLVWGGQNNPYFTNSLNDGGRFNPSNNTWNSLPTTGAPAGRIYHTAIWTGSEMIIWGGVGANGSLTDGARFNPSSNTWRAISMINAPSDSYDFSAVWTGSQMILWDGSSQSDQCVSYDPSSDTWTPLTGPLGILSQRHYSSATWTGSEMLIFGGDSVTGGTVSDGARYNPIRATWTPLSAADAPPPRDNPSTVWAGSKFLMWGGWDGFNYFNDLYAYTPNPTAFIYIKP